MAGRALTIDVTTRDQQTLAALKRIQRELGQLDKKVDQSTTHSSGLGEVLGGLAVGAGIKMAVDEFEEAERGARQTEAVIRSTGNAAQVSAGQQAEYADSLSKMAAVDDDVINSGMNLLRTFTNVKGEAFEPATKAALNMSAALGTDLQSNIQLVGKALQDPAAGLAKLTRAGVIFTQQQKDQIRSLQESGDMLGAQKVILAELEKEFGGQAEAAATSSARMKVAFGEAAESLGGTLVPALQVGATAAQAAAEAFDVLPGPIKALAVAGAGAAIIGPKIAEGWSRAGSALDGLRTKSREISQGTASMTTKLQGAAVGVGALTGAVLSGVEAWQQWGQAGTDAASQFLDDLAAKAPHTAEGYRDLAKASQEYADGLLGAQEGGLRSLTIDRDLNRSLQEGAGAARARGDAYAAAADKIEQAAKKTGLSVSDVESIIADANLDPTKLNVEELAKAIADWGNESGAASPKARLAADAANEQADKFAKATDAAHSLFDAQTGVDEAARGVTEAQRGVADAHAAVEDAERSLADAHRGVADAARGVREAEAGLADASAELADARRAAAEGSRELRDANQAVRDAEAQVAQAQRDSRQAQLDLTQARVDAAEQLDDLSRSTQGAVLDEKDAQLSLLEARKRLQELGANGEEVDPEDRARAALAVQRAELAVANAIDRREEAEAELADAQAKGIEGSDAVTAAKERIVEAAGRERDAQDRVREAQERVTEVQEQLAKRVVDAQSKVEEASLRVRDAHQAVADAQQRVSDAAGSVVDARARVVEAEDGVTQALLAQIEARQVLDAMQVGATGAVRQQIERYRELAGTLAPDSPLRQHLLQLADALEGVSGVYDITLALHTLGEDASPGARNAERAGRASGGPVRAGVEYRVNEAGEEFFTPSVDGVVHPSRTAFEAAVADREAYRARRTAGTSGAQILVTVGPRESPEEEGRRIGAAVYRELSVRGVG